MSERSLDRFIEYIRGKKQQVPMAFILSSDGYWSTYWYCPMMKDCRSANFMPTIRQCEEDTGVECGLFARRYTILWKNGTNPGKGKASTIKKKWSDSEMRAKLTELGFLGGSTSSTPTTTTPKITKKFKKDVVYFNKCASKYTDKKEYYDSFEIDLKKDTIYMEFFGEGEIYESRIKIALNNDNFIQTVIDEYGDDSYVRYRFSKKNDEVTSFFFKDKKGKIKDYQYILSCDDIVGTLNNQKVEKKITKKIVKKYTASGERSIALSWDGYEDLIAGTVEFDEANYKGTLNAPLPNNDGTCDGTYSLQEGGKGTWQITCTNNMGAAGTLKWTKNGGVTGSGRDHNDKKVKFTVSKKS